MPPQLGLVEADQTTVFRVGFPPDPWAWSDWIWAVDGRFDGRWDDAAGNFRTIYAGSTLLGCLLEVLACFRPDPVLVDEVAAIEEDIQDATEHPTVPAGAVAHDWAVRRRIGTAQLSGQFCAVTSAETIAALRPTFIRAALSMGLHDFDAAALKDGQPRALTQAVAKHLHETTDLAGVNFNSRLGDELTLWAIFERAGDPPVSPTLSMVANHQLPHDHPSVQEAFSILGLEWADPAPAPMPLPIAALPGDEVWLRHTTGGDPDPATPWGAACTWWQGLSDPQEYLHALQLMSSNPEAWGDYTEAAAAIADLVLRVGNSHGVVGVKSWGHGESTCPGVGAA